VENIGVASLNLCSSLLQIETLASLDAGLLFVLKLYESVFLTNNKPVPNGTGFLLDVENIGVEPMTFWLPAKRSSQLS
tara:strand:- start:229096 stop:229329 length:234 start_codon:yes stop_codon:yes gene_type:complete